MSVKCCSLGIVGSLGMFQKTFQWQSLVSLSLGLQTGILDLERQFYHQKVEREMCLFAVTLCIVLDGTLL